MSCSVHFRRVVMQSARCIFGEAQVASDSKLSHLEVQSSPLEAKLGRSAVWATNNSPGSPKRADCLTLSVFECSWGGWIGLGGSIVHRERVAPPAQAPCLPDCSLRAIVGIEFSHAARADSVSEFRPGMGLNINFQDLPLFVLILNSLAGRADW